MKLQGRKRLSKGTTKIRNIYWVESLSVCMVRLSACLSVHLVYLCTSPPAPSPSPLFPPLPLPLLPPPSSHPSPRPSSLPPSLPPWTHTHRKDIWFDDVDIEMVEGEPVPKKPRLEQTRTSLVTGGDKRCSEKYHSVLCVIV